MHKPKASIDNLMQAVTVGDIRSALAKELCNKDFLIVLDDVWDRKVVGAFQFPDFAGKVLVTTRDKSISQTSATLVQILPSDYQEVSEALLRRLAFRSSPEAFSLPADYRVSLSTYVCLCVGGYLPGQACL